MSIIESLVVSLLFAWFVLTVPYILGGKKK